MFWKLQHLHDWLNTRLNALLGDGWCSLGLPEACARMDDSCLVE